MIPAKYADRLGKIREIIGSMINGPDEFVMNPDVPDEISEPLVAFYEEYGRVLHGPHADDEDQFPDGPLDVSDIESDLSSSGEMSEELDPDEIGIGGMA